MVYTGKREGADPDEPDGMLTPVKPASYLFPLDSRQNRTRSKSEGNLLIMGPLNPHRFTHSSVVHELSVADKKSTGRARDGHVYICWNGGWPRVAVDSSTLRVGRCELRLSVLFQSTSASDHPSIWL